MKNASTGTTTREATTRPSPGIGEAGSPPKGKKGRRPKAKPSADVSASLGPYKPGDLCEVVIGIDLGDRESHFCVLSMASGAVLERGVFRMKGPELQKTFGSRPRARIILEAGGQSAWVSRSLEAMGHEVLVANPSRMALGGRRRRKTDRIDAEQLARIGRADPKLLYAIRHRSAEWQADLALLRARDVLVRSRTSLVNHARGIVKTTGERLPSSSAAAFARNSRPQVPAQLRPALDPILDSISEMSDQIRVCDREIERLAVERYPETSLLTAIGGVGALTALAYVLTLESPGRFRKSRSAGAYVGLCPGIHESGDSAPELRISKAGSGFLRRLLVQSAHYILGPFGKECDLRRFGARLAGSRGKSRRKRAVVAVARKLAVLLHRLWSRGEAYDPDYQLKRSEALAPLAVPA